VQAGEMGVLGGVQRVTLRDSALLWYS